MERETEVTIGIFHSQSILYVIRDYVLHHLERVVSFGCHFNMEFVFLAHIPQHPPDRSNPVGKEKLRRL